MPSMQILKNQQLFGYPALEVRRLMRACGDHRWSIGIVALTLHISRDRATELVGAMLADDLIAESLDPESHRTRWEMIVEDPHGPRYELAMKGNALAMASAKPIRRLTAERLVSDFLQRVEEVNNDPNLLFWIDEVLVFGSFLTNSEMLGDVDLALMYVHRKENGTDWNARAKARVKEAQANGRNFPLYMDEFLWPLREIQLRLRKRSSSLSLHDLDIERTFIEALPHQQIYLRRNGPTTGSRQMQ
jgi:hypothetical protein